MYPARALSARSGCLPAGLKAATALSSSSHHLLVCTPQSPCPPWWHLPFPQSAHQACGAQVAPSHLSLDAASFSRTRRGRVSQLPGISERFLNIVTPCSAGSQDGLEHSSGGCGGLPANCWCAGWFSSSPRPSRATPVPTLGPGSAGPCGGEAWAPGRPPSRSDM